MDSFAVAGIMYEFVNYFEIRKTKFSNSVFDNKIFYNNMIKFRSYIYSLENMY